MFKLWILPALAATVAFACSSDYSIWIPRSKTADPLYRFTENGKAGYIDRTGRIVIRPTPTFDRLGNYGAEFHDGRLEIAVGDGKYIDRSGKIVIDEDLYRGWDFSEGLAVAMREDKHLWGFINTSGKFAISPRFESSPNGYVSSFTDSLARIEVKGKSGYIDHSGEFVIPPQFLAASDFSNGMARVVTDGPCVYGTDGACGSVRFVGGQQSGETVFCKFTFIDKTGRLISKDRFDQARDFSEELAPVRIGKLWGFIDKNGLLVVPAKFADAEPFSSGLARIRDGQVYGYADKGGQIAIAPRYRYAEDFSEGFAVVGDGSAGYWYIDQKGRRTTWGDFQAASPFFKGLAHVMLHTDSDSDTGAAFAYIDTKGRRVFTYRDDQQE